MRYPPGTVLLADIPYIDLTKTKQRPAVVVSSDALYRCHGDMVLLAITSNMNTVFPFEDLALQHWKEAGLPKPSQFKPTLFTMAEETVKGVFGKVSDADHLRIKTLLHEMLVL